MKAVILAAGKSSRFYPFNVTHKSLFPLMGKPILSYTIEAVKTSGVTDIIIIVSPDSAIPEIIGDGKALGVSLTYVVQEKAEGMGHALLCAKEYLDGDFFLLSAHRVDFADYAQSLLSTRKNNSEIVLVGKRENVLGKYGVVKIEGDRVLDLIEKPKSIDPETDVRVLGNYLLNREYLEVLEKTPLSHYHLEEALATFAKTRAARVFLTEKESFSLKYPWDLFQLKKYVFSRTKPSISKHAKIAKSAQVVGPVIIEEGAEIMESAVIRGPAYIGKNVLVGNNSVVRNESILENNVKVGMNTEVKNVIMGEGSSIHSGSIEDSIVGSRVKIGAFFCTSNVRLDRGTIPVEIDDKKVNSGISSLGAIIGNDVKCGVRVTTMPGIVIGRSSIIGPSTTIMKNIPDDTTFYTTFKENIEKKRKEK